MSLHLGRRAGVMKEYWTVKDKLSGERLMSGGWTVNSTGWWKFDSRISALEKLVQLQKHYPTMRHIIVVYHKLKTKPRGAKVGTWAWACEQMLSGSVVWKSAHQTRYYLSYDRELLSAAKRATVTAQMMRDTSWGVIP